MRDLCAWLRVVMVMCVLVVVRVGVRCGPVGASRCRRLGVCSVERKQGKFHRSQLNFIQIHVYHLLIAQSNHVLLQQWCSCTSGGVGGREGGERGGGAEGVVCWS